MPLIPYIPAYFTSLASPLHASTSNPFPAYPKITASPAPSALVLDPTPWNGNDGQYVFGANVAESDIKLEKRQEEWTTVTVTVIEGQTTTTTSSSQAGNGGTTTITTTISVPSDAIVTKTVTVWNAAPLLSPKRAIFIGVLVFSTFAALI
ncbi:hypothetical protein BT69DRAFT_1353101 [Atractiella rhizophila]|nr:hypothetical protein BT69DRAFT_1353101 [Atractiella rhizophila]